MDGLLNLDDFEDETGIELPEGPYETVAGFLMAQLGRLAEVGDSVDLEGHRIVVRDVESRRVGRVLGSPSYPGAAGDPRRRGRPGVAAVAASRCRPPITSRTEDDKAS